jgi:predicted nucleic acid-binding protein
MNLFIDTNIYLTFFHFSNDDLEELKKLKVAIQDGKINLLLPEQVIEEYKRNREIKIADALKEFDKLKLPSQFPRMCKDYPQYEKLREKITQYDELKSDLLEQLNSDIESKQLGADKLIEELFEVATKIPSSPSIISVAKERYDKGNPPGKNGSYGDAINWESLLLYQRKNHRQQEVIEDLHIVARDKDYSSPIDPEKFSRYLSDEWREKKSSEINYYKSLSDFFSERFPDIRLASDLERQLLKLPSIQILLHRK